MTSGFDSATAAHAFKLAFYTKALTLFDATNTHVSFGYPGGGRDVSKFLAFMELRTEQAPATVSTNRSRDEDIYLTTVISCARAGQADDDLAASQDAYDILRTLERQVRITDTSVSGTVLWCFLNSTDSGGATDAAVLAKGRLIQIEATFKARVRITA